MLSSAYRTGSAFFPQYCDIVNRAVVTFYIPTEQKLLCAQGYWKLESILLESIFCCIVGAFLYVAHFLI